MSIKLKQLLTNPMPDPEGVFFLQLTGLTENGEVFAYNSTNGRWFPLSMEVESLDERAKKSGLEIVQ